MPEDGSSRRNMSDQGPASAYIVHAVKYFKGRDSRLDVYTTKMHVPKGEEDASSLAGFLVPPKGDVLLPPKREGDAALLADSLLPKADDAGTSLAGVLLPPKGDGDEASPADFLLPPKSDGDESFADFLLPPKSDADAGSSADFVLPPNGEDDKEPRSCFHRVAQRHQFEQHLQYGRVRKGRPRNRECLINKCGKQYATTLQYSDGAPWHWLLCRRRTCWQRQASSARPPTAWPA